MVSELLRVGNLTLIDLSNKIIETFHHGSSEGSNLPDSRSDISSLLEHLRREHPGVLWGDRRPRQPIGRKIARVTPSEQRGSRWGTDGVSGIRVGELEALLTKLIQMRRRNSAVRRCRGVETGLTPAKICDSHKADKSTRPRLTPSLASGSQADTRKAKGGRTVCHDPHNVRPLR